MRPISIRLISTGATMSALSLACTDAPVSPDTAPAGAARAYGIWAPGPYDTCTQEIHDAYATIGPDGRLYPTWHPPVDPGTGCTFGHEHGRDPSGSDLYGVVGEIPFGFANEALDVWDPANPRHEDHVGHKIEWANDVVVRFDGAIGERLFEVTCDVLTKLHQGTHSKDAFTNNLHELAYHVRCSDGTAIHVTVMAAIGRPGEFRRSCDSDVTIAVGPATPPGSPAGGGHRIIPDRTCIDRFAFVPEGQEADFDRALRESWEVSISIRTAEGRGLAHFNPYFQVLDPSRFYDPTEPDNVGRSVAVCFEEMANGFRPFGDACAASTDSWTLADLAYDDPRSAFAGARRFVDINGNDLDNAEGPSVWFTDPFGRNARPDSFPGAIRQRLATIDNGRGIGSSGPTIGRDRPYSGNGVHPPN